LNSYPQSLCSFSAVITTSFVKIFPGFLNFKFYFHKTLPRVFSGFDNFAGEYSIRTFVGVFYNFLRIVARDYDAVAPRTSLTVKAIKKAEK
jgi:hypothetical protein